VFAYKGQREDVRAIGARLGVTTVLEGSVRKAGNRLRVMAQLIDVPNGRLLWSERFDRDDRDVFAIQEELARTIVSTLRANLLGTLGDPLPKRYTENLAAYNLYLRGRHSRTNHTGGRERAIRSSGAPSPRIQRTSPAGSPTHTAAARLPRGGGEGCAGPRDGEQGDRAHDRLAEAHIPGWVHFIHDWDWGRGPSAGLECNPATPRRGGGTRGNGRRSGRRLSAPRRALVRRRCRSAAPGGLFRPAAGRGGEISCAPCP
jgi:serine/threonine-protein kinase